MHKNYNIKLFIPMKRVVVFISLMFRIITVVEIKTEHNKPKIHYEDEKIMSTIKIFLLRSRLVHMAEIVLNQSLGNFK